MNRRRPKTLTLLAALLAVIGLFGVSGAVSSTQAAWSDRVNVAAKVTAGTWLSPNTCIAWADAEKKQPLSCAIAKITMKPWGNGPRDYRVYFTTQTQAPTPTPKQAYWVQFTVDLSSATLEDGTQISPADKAAWSWSGATVVAAGAQFTPVGWTCTDLPFVRGQSLAWGTDSYFVVQPASPTAAPALCR